MTPTDRPGFKARIGDPTQGIGRAPAVILPDAASLFARRAGRLRMLADGNPMEAWLRFLAGLADTQQSAVAGIEPPAVAAHQGGEPPLRNLPLGSAWAAILAALAPAVADAPEETQSVFAAFRAEGAEAQQALANAYLQGAVPAGRAGAALLAAAALQVWYCRAAAVLQADALDLPPERSHCPACGFAAVAGVVTAAGALPGTRYLHCGLCATAWNHVRAVCTGCGESGGLVLQQIEGGSDVAKAETCSICKGYLKQFYEAHDMAVEPFADDIASLGLDMLVSEAGFVRIGPSPFLIAG
jgi:FdhE protein